VANDGFELAGALPARDHRPDEARGGDHVGRGVLVLRLRRITSHPSSIASTTAASATATIGIHHDVRGQASSLATTSITVKA
jgi:hypothetical protein